MDDIITPAVKVPMRSLAFCAVFGLVMVILSIIAGASKIINRIPIIASVNGAAGAVLGLLEALVVIMIVCIITRLLISLCGSSLIVINETTIEKTFIFRYFYSIDPLSLLGIGLHG